MAGGWSRDGDVQDQIDQSIADAVGRARQTLAGGVGRSDCAICGEAIPTARRQAVPGVRHCVPCQENRDTEVRIKSVSNRRGSKGSQLR